LFLDVGDDVEDVWLDIAALMKGDIESESVNHMPRWQRLSRPHIFKRAPCLRARRPRISCETYYDSMKGSVLSRTTSHSDDRNAPKCNEIITRNEVLANLRATMTMASLHDLMTRI
jgi:hypothetical protein